MSEWQLRDYRIETGRLDEFVAAWTNGVLPLRRRFGFTIQAWTVPDEDRFVWIVGWDGPGSFADVDARYYASPERRAVHPDPSVLIAEQRVVMLTPIEVVQPDPER